MTIGSVIYVIPFVFVLDPSLILQHGWGRVVVAVLEAAAGIWLMVGARCKVI